VVLLNQSAIGALEKQGKVIASSITPIAASVGVLPLRGLRIQDLRRLLRVHNIVDGARGFLHLSLQFIDGCFAPSASRFHRVLECRECVGHVVEVCSDISQLAIGVHDASSLKSVEALIDTNALRHQLQVLFGGQRPLRCRNLMSPADDHRTGHDTDVELRRRRQGATRTSPGSGSVEADGGAALEPGE
jgi:hypothetical protein